MRFILWTVTAVVGLAVGMAVAPDRPAPDPSPADAPSTESAPPADRTDAPPAETSAPAPASESAAPPAEAFATVLAEYPERTYDRHDGEITGVVLDANDVPVEGIVLDLVVHGTTPGVEPRGIDHPELIGFLREEVDQYHFDRAYMRRAVSGPDGTFAFTELDPEWEYHVHGAPGNVRYITADGGGTQLSPGSTLTVRALRAAEVTVEVVDTIGGRVPAAFVWAQGTVGGEGATYRWWVSEEVPTIRIPVVTPRLSARAVSGEPAMPEEFVLAEGEPTSVRLVVQGRSGIDVTLTGATEPIDLVDLMITFVDLDGLERVPDDWAELIWAGRTHQPSGARSRVDLSSGRYAAILSRGREVLEVPTVEVREGTRTEWSFEVPPIDRAEVYRVTVRNRAGDLIDEAEFVGFAGVEYPGHPQLQETYLNLQTARVGPGDYMLRLDRRWIREGMTIRSLDIDARHTDYGSVRVPSPTPGVPCTAVFEDPARIRVELEGYVGHPLQGNVKVRLGDEEGRPDLQGFVSFGPVAPGPVVAHVTAQRFEIIDEARGIPIDLRPGWNAITLPIPDVYDLVVAFPDATPGDFVSLRIIEGSVGMSARVDADLRVVFRDLPAASYTVDVPGTPGMTVDVPAGGVVPYTTSAFDCLAVVQVEAQGWLARAGFREGDQVIGLDGRAIEELGQLRFAVMRAISRGEGAIAIERGGAEMTIEVPAGTPPLSHELGGYLSPAVRGGGR